MASNFLQLNADKTEVLVVVPDSIASKVMNCLGSLLLCILATCLQPGLNETIKRLNSPVFPVTVWSDGAAGSPHGPSLQL